MREKRLYYQLVDMRAKLFLFDHTNVDERRRLDRARCLIAIKTVGSGNLGTERLAITPAPRSPLLTTRPLKCLCSDLRLCVVPMSRRLAAAVGTNETLLPRQRGDDPTKTFTVYAVAKDGAKPMVSTFTDDQFVPHTSPNNSAAAR